MGVLAARWPGTPARDGQPEVRGGRQHIEGFEAKIADRGWPINREVLLRITSVLSLESPNHTRLLGLDSTDAWKVAWARTEAAVNHAVGFLKTDVGIPAKSLLPTEYVLLLPAVFLEQTHGALQAQASGIRSLVGAYPVDSV